MKNHLKMAPEQVNSARKKNRSLRIPLVDWLKLRKILIRKDIDEEIKLKNEMGISTRQNDLNFHFKFLYLSWFEICSLYFTPIF